MAIPHGIRQIHASRLVPAANGFIRHDIIQVMRYPLACLGCHTGQDCLIGSWRYVDLVLKRGPAGVLNIVPPVPDYYLLL
jgi:hypothetical protein